MSGMSFGGGGGLTQAQADARYLALAGGTITGGSLDIVTAGQGIKIATGANAKLGTATLAAGTVTVANTSVTANSKIFISDISGGANVGFLDIGVITAGVSFVVNSSNALDTSSFNYLIVEPG